MYQHRKEISDESLDKAIAFVIKLLRSRLDEKGKKIFASRHECFGSITEEYHELVEAVRSNEHIEFDGECADVAVAAIFSIASSIEGMDW